MLKLERYIKAFSVFDDVVRGNLDILAVSGFFAVVAWVFASSLLYVPRVVPFVPIYRIRLMLDPHSATGVIGVSSTL